MARSGKYLYYCNGSGTYCTPLYDSTECFTCNEAYKTYFTVKDSVGTYYTPIFNSHPNECVEGEPYLRYNSDYLAQSNGFLSTTYYEYNKGPGEIIGRCTWEACGTAKMCTLNIVVHTEIGHVFSTQVYKCCCIHGYMPVVSIAEKYEEYRKNTTFNVSRCNEYYAWSAWSSTHTGAEGGSYWAEAEYLNHPDKYSASWISPHLFIEAGKNPYSNGYTTTCFRCVCITPYRLKISDSY